MSMHYEFESLAEAFEHMKMMEAQANARVVPRQRRITWGAYWIRPMPDIGITVFGRVMTEQEILSGEQEAGASLEEAEQTLRHIQGVYQRGYRFGRCYSTIEPEGELGDTHIANCWPITEEQFREAEVLGWDSRVILKECNWLADALIDFNNAYFSR